jgi:putative membrane protein
MVQWQKTGAADVPAAAAEPVAAHAQPAPWVRYWHKGAFIAFLLCWALNVVLLALGVEPRGAGRWVEAALLVTAAATTLLTLAKRLPLQNVVSAALLIALISGTVIAPATVSGIPFGPFTYSDVLGGKLFGALPWTIPLLWIVVIVNSRGVARLIMRPWRKTNYYGFWVIGLTCALALVLDLGLEPFAARVKHYWAWRAPAWVPQWYSAPWVNFLGWLVVSLGVMAFTTPWLINKRPVKLPMDYHPLATWLLINLYFALGNALHGLWGAAAITVAGGVIASTFAVRGARW